MLFYPSKQKQYHPLHAAVGLKRESAQRIAPRSRYHLIVSVIDRNKSMQYSSVGITFLIWHRLLEEVRARVSLWNVQNVEAEAASTLGAKWLNVSRDLETFK